MKTGRDHTPHIGIYGRTNAGKSTLLNRLIGQQAVIVSPEAGTTTDPVRRVFELTDFGPVVFIDTAGIDDSETELGRLRVQKTMQTLLDIDLGIVLLYGMVPDATEQRLIDTIRANDIPYIMVPARGRSVAAEVLLENIRRTIPEHALAMPPFFGQRFISAGDVILLVCPIDGAAPAGRLILPQVQALRAALDLGAVAITVQPEQLRRALQLCNPRLIITDSQLFKEVSTVAGELYPEVEVTSFSILLAEQKGDVTVYREGLKAVDTLKAGDRVLIIENCSHQVTCDDIGRSKMPGWLSDFTGLDDLRFTFVTGRDPLPADLSISQTYALAVQCGGCVSTRRMIQARIQAVLKCGVPITNYGMLIRKLRVRR